MSGRPRGQITVFLSLMLMLLISFLCTALRSAQTAGSRYLFSLAAEASARSVFGAYDTRVWEQYRILMLTDRALAETIGQECADSYSKNGTLFPVKVTSVQLIDPVTVAENGAAGWEEEAVSYMEMRLPVEVVSQLMEQTGLLDGLDQVGEWMADFRGMIKPLFQLEKKLCQLEKKLEKAVDAYRQGKQLLTELRSSAEMVRQLLAAAGEEEMVDPEQFFEIWSALETSYEKVRNYLQDSGRDLEELSRQAREDLEQISGLQEQIRELIGKLTGQADAGLSALADLGGYLSGLTERFSFLERLPGQLSQQMDYLRRIAQVRLPTAEEVLDGAGEAALEFLQGLLEGFLGEIWSPEQLEVSEGTQEDEEKAGTLMQLKEWLDQGVLSLVMEDPSQTSTAALGRSLSRTERSEDNGLTEELYRSLLYGEYALRYTARYGQEGGAGLQYETEYLAAGKSSDRANLAAVASRLLVVRGTLNFLYLLQDSGSKEALRMTAAGISAALGGWIPAGLVSVLMMVVWAMAEAVCDVRSLLAGQKVAFWKDSGSWTLGFSHLWSLLEGDFFFGRDQQEGMAYEEYLRLLLLAVPTEEKCYRTMEVAEENLRAQRNDFSMDQGWYRGVVVLSGQAAGQSMELGLEYGY